MSLPDLPVDLPAHLPEDLPGFAGLALAVVLVHAHAVLVQNPRKDW